MSNNFQSNWSLMGDIPFTYHPRETCPRESGERGSSMKPGFLLEFTLVRTGAGITYSAMHHS